MPVAEGVEVDAPNGPAGPVCWEESVDVKLPVPKDGVVPVCCTLSPEKLEPKEPVPPVCWVVSAEVNGVLVEPLGWAFSAPVRGDAMVLDPWAPTDDGVAVFWGWILEGVWFWIWV